MDMKNLPIGTKLESEYGTWVITHVTRYQNCTWYDLRGDRGSVVVYPSNIGTLVESGTHYKVVV